MPYSVEILDSIADLPVDLRAAWVGDDPFLLPGFLDALEAHGAAGPEMAWEPQHLVLREAGEILGWMPLYLRRHSFGDFLRDWSWPGAWERLGQHYYPKLVTGLPYTPVSGPRLIAAERALRPRLIAAAMQAVEASGASSWHVGFPTAGEAELLEAHGLLLQPQIQFQWFNRGYRDFEDYLATFASAKRRKVNAERRKVEEAGLALQVFGGQDVPPSLWPHLQRLYANTFHRYGNHPAISAPCFADMAATLGERMQVFVAFRDGRAIAVAICFRSGEALYGRYWGAEEEVPGLHFELCYYQGIDYCIRQGLGRFEPGAGGEHKLARGFEPTRVVTAHWIASPQMRGILRRHLAQLDGAIEDYRAEAASHLPFKAGT